MTGTVNLSAGLTAKRMDLLKQTVPTLSRLAMPRDLSNPANRLNVEGAQAAAQTLGLQLQLLDLLSGADLDAAFEAASQHLAEAVLVVGGALLTNNRARIVELAARHRLPALYEFREYADTGGLMAYGASVPAGFRRAATYVDKILKGTAPADLPVEGPSVFDFVINLKTAHALGLTIPQSVLQQATEIIQ